MKKQNMKNLPLAINELDLQYEANVALQNELCLWHLETTKLTYRDKKSLGLADEFNLKGKIHSTAALIQMQVSFHKQLYYENMTNCCFSTN